MMFKTPLVAQLVDISTCDDRCVILTDWVRYELDGHSEHNSTHEELQVEVYKSTMRRRKLFFLRYAINRIMHTCRLCRVLSKSSVTCTQGVLEKASEIGAFVNKFEDTIHGVLEAVVQGVPWLNSVTELKDHISCAYNTNADIYDEHFKSVIGYVPSDVMKFLEHDTRSAWGVLELICEASQTCIILYDTQNRQCRWFVPIVGEMDETPPVVLLRDDQSRVFYHIQDT